jgi:hypothetical protein
MQSASTIQALGAFLFGMVLGWFAYYVNRYRTDKVQLSDVATFLGAVGGAAVLALFPAKTDLFGYYGLGLGVGFFLYFLILVVLVMKSKRFKSDFFLDGRAPKLADDEIQSGQRAMGRPGGGHI